MTFLESLKKELKYRYLNHLAGPVFIGLFLFFSKASYSMIFLYSIGLFVGLVTINAYMKAIYRKTKK